MTFDEHDPWHQNAHLLFGFQCNECDAMIGYGDVASGPEEDFIKFCIDVTEEAKKRGWACVQEFEFYCPECAKSKDLAKTLAGIAHSNPNPSFKRDA